MEEARKPSVQSWLVGLREWSLKWLERWLAKRGIKACRSWIWWAAFGLSKRWALHNPIFLPKHWDTLSLERQRWKLRVCACLCVCFLFTDVAVGPGMGPEEVQNILWVDSIKWRVQETKRQSGKETMCTSLDQHWAVGDRVLTATPLKLTRSHVHTSAFPCLSVKGLKGPSKSGREIGQGPAGSLSSPLEDQGRLKVPGLLSLPCYPPLLSAQCIRTLETPPGGAEHNQVD